MKIAYIINHLGETGLNNVVLDLVDAFVKHKHKCKVFFLKNTENPMVFPCETELLNGQNRNFFDFFDVIHIHGLGPSLYVLRHKPLHCQAKVISTFHNYVFQDYTSTYGIFKGIGLAIALLISTCKIDKIVTLSKDAQTYYKRWLPKRKLTYAYNTRIINRNLQLTDTEKQEIKTFKDNDILIGMNGLLIHRKGIDIMLTALQNLPSQYKLMLVGDGDGYEKYHKFVIDNHLDKRVLFAGRHPKAYRYLPFFDLYVLCSRSEGFPLALLEAADYGCNIVCSDLPILQECFTNKEVTFCHKGDSKSLAHAIIESSSFNKGLFAKKRFNDFYSPNVFYNRYLHIYQETI